MTDGTNNVDFLLEEGARKGRAVAAANQGAYDKEALAALYLGFELAVRNQQNPTKANLSLADGSIVVSTTPLRRLKAVPSDGYLVVDLSPLPTQIYEYKLKAGGMLGGLYEFLLSTPNGLASFNEQQIASNLLAILGER